MGKYFTVENGINKNNNKKKIDARRSLNNYIDQLKIHFELEEKEIISILNSLTQSKKNKYFIKKWWHIWK